ncbi:hypothetical protein F5Y01DRAFT_195509 [Xylaria sp. FL0043]|nr:hypothetical protein F5Y01DRAFT_195509 [Xylaria sp. FL0043]
MLSLLILFLGLLARLGAGAPEPKISITPILPPSPTGPLAPLISLLENIGNSDPPDFLSTPDPSPECATERGGNGGQLQCCRATVAGDLPVVVDLADVIGYKLNPNDINGVICDDQLDECPGVRVCCEVTALSPLLSLYCADYNPH